MKPNEWQDVTAEAEAAQQIEDAMRILDLPSDAVLRWPWASLDAMYGGMMPGTTHYVVGFSGMGKTTFIASALERWRKQGELVDVLPLELKPENFRTYLACQAEGIDPGYILSGDSKVGPGATELWERVTRRLAAQKDETQVRIHGVDFVDVERLEAICAQAQERGAKAVIVDHIDHVDGTGKGKSDVETSRAVNYAAFRLAKDYSLALILMSQANNDALRVNNDYLAKYNPLRETSVWMGSYKRQVATGMLGLFRPTRPIAPGETLEEYTAAYKRARTGEDPPASMLLAGRAGISLMKSRNYGSRDGQRIQLAVRHGYYDDLNASERADDEAQAHGIRTSTGLRLEKGA